jgi:anthranilate phosphoribosyltransferase
MYTIQQTIQKILDKYAFNQKEAEQVMTGLLKQPQSLTQIAALLTAYRLKDEELPELTGLANVVRKAAVKIDPNVKKIVDIGGTGGSLINSFNVSVLASFVVAGAGLAVAKQVDVPLNKNTCCPANVLPLLGIDLLDPKKVEKCIEKTGVGFLYVPYFHPKLEQFFAVRQELEIRTVLNILIRLAHPVSLDGIVLGVYKEKLTTLAAAVLRNLGIKRAMVVHGVEGLDEISLSGMTRISDLNKGTINTYVVSPEDLGVNSASVSTIIGGSCEENAQVAKVILSGQEHSPRTDMVLINAAAALYVGGVAPTLKDGIQIAQKSLYSGAALARWKAVQDFCAGKKKPGKTIKQKTKKLPAKKKKKTVKAKKKKR